MGGAGFRPAVGGIALMPYVPYWDPETIQVHPLGNYPVKGGAMTRRDRPERLRALVDEWRQSGEDGLPDEIQRLLQEANNRPVAKPLRFRERYLQRALRVHLHLVGRKVSIEGKEEDLCICVTGVVRWLDAR